MTFEALSSNFRLLRGVILAVSFLAACPCPAEEPVTNSTTDASPSAAGAAKDMVAKSTQDLAAGNLDQAIDDINRAIQLDSNNAAAFELRGSIYIEKKLWDRAERDYTKANQISPDIAYKYKLAEIKFLQKAYGDARFRFAALQADPRLGDLAVYKVFLCDLLGGHPTIAAQDLGVIDRAEKRPSYYFSHAAWAWYHHQKEEMGKCFTAARKLYDESINQLYISSLVEAQAFQPTVATFTTKDGRHYDKAPVFLEIQGLRVSTPKGWITISVDQLPDDLSSLPEQIRDSITKKRAILPAVTTPVSLLSFTSKSGRSFDNVRWSLEDTGLSLLTPDGWTIIPFEQLPDDLSTFPKDLQDLIAKKRAALSSATVSTSLLSFTSKSGKSYDQVRWSLEGTGLSVLTSDGWTTVPFEQLPANLSSFPPDLRQTIDRRRLFAQNTSAQTDVISFTTKQGKEYDEVRASLTNQGIRILTPDGWVVVPFEQLPHDLSPFPADWCQQIRARRQASPSDPSGMKLVSFTTRKGKCYDQVRAAMERTGLRLLTSQGLIAVPFDQLPDDVSVFPEEWQEQIMTKRKSTAFSPPAGSTNR